MVMFGRRMDWTSLIVQGVSSAAGGGAQELAWRQTQNTGLIATALAIGGGIALKLFSNGGVLEDIGTGVYLSGASVAGWKLAERNVDQGSPSFQPRVSRPSVRSAYTPQIAPARPRVPARVPAPVSHANYVRPQVSLSGVNPNTGEEILYSRV